MRSLLGSLGRGVIWVLLAAFIAIAIAGPFIWGHAASVVHLGAIDQDASWQHPFGTDDLGRDLLNRTLVATRISLGLACLTGLLGFVLGVALGSLPAVTGRRTSRLVTSAIGFLIAFPALLLALLVVTVMGIGSTSLVIAIAVALAPPGARLTQTLAAEMAGADHVDAARAVGVRGPRLLVRHVLPSVASPLVLQLAMSISSALLSFSALSFIGLGIQEPSYDWGRLLEVGFNRIYVTPAAALGPAAVIILASVLINLVGDRVATALAGEQRPEPARVSASAQTAMATVPEPARLEDAVPALRVEDLTVSIETGAEAVVPVRNISFVVRPGERVGLVGESGSGKSLTASAVAGLLEPPVSARQTVELDGVDLAGLRRRERDRALATGLAVVLQNSLHSLNPSLRNGTQLIESARVHLRTPRARARARAATWLRKFGVSAVERRLKQYPHELSGGMRQRAVIAMGLMVEPHLIIADEATTALDVTVQRQVLRALHRVNVEAGTAIMLISHDISVVTAFCERILVMYGGRIVEELDSADLAAARHPYTRALLAAVPDMRTDRHRRLLTIPGRPPAAHEIPDGCPFAPRCERADETCRSQVPPLRNGSTAGLVACWHPHERADSLQASSGSREHI